MLQVGIGLCQITKASHHEVPRWFGADISNFNVTAQAIDQGIGRSKTPYFRVPDLRRGVFKSGWRCAASQKPQLDLPAPLAKGLFFINKVTFIAINGVVGLSMAPVGSNFLFTGRTTLAMKAWTPAEKDRGQATINFFVFATMAVTSFASGALVTTQGWMWLNIGSILPVALTVAALVWMVLKQRDAQKSAPATSA